MATPREPRRAARPKRRRGARAAPDRAATARPPSGASAARAAAPAVASAGRGRPRPPTATARLRAELDELTRVKRPQVIARIRTAKEHGDLKENAEYHAAREEQSFLEGRVQAIEARLALGRHRRGAGRGLAGSASDSMVTVDDDGEIDRRTRSSGRTEFGPGTGPDLVVVDRSGRALVGRDSGDDVRRRDAGRASRRYRDPRRSVGPRRRA